VNPQPRRLLPLLFGLLLTVALSACGTALQTAYPGQQPTETPYNPYPGGQPTATDYNPYPGGVTNTPRAATATQQVGAATATQPRQTAVSPTAYAATSAPRTPSPTPTITPTRTRAPTATAGPSPTATAIFWVGTATPLPDNLPPIGAANAAQVSGLAEFNDIHLTDLAWGPDSRTLAVSTFYGINLWDVYTRLHLRALYPKTEGIVDIAFSPDGRWLLAGGRRGSETTGYAGSLELWQGPDWRPRGPLWGDNLSLTGLTFSPDGEHLLTSFTGPEPSGLGHVQFWNTRTWEITATAQTGIVLEMAFSPDGKLLALSPDRSAIKVWDLKNMSVLYTFPTSFTGAVNSLAFSPEGTMLASGHYDGAVRFWDMASGQESGIHLQTGGVVESLAYSPDGKLIATGDSYGDTYVQLWVAGTGELLRTLDGHRAGVEQLIFSPAGTLLVSGGWDGNVRLWGVRP
jgi:hypothetical protein